MPILKCQKCGHEHKESCQSFCKLFAEAKTADQTFHEEKCKLCHYRDFYNEVAVMYCEGVEFMTKLEIYEHIKKELNKHMGMIDE